MNAELTPKKLTPEKAEELLPDDEWIHVFTMPGEPEGECWARARILRHFKEFGVELADVEAMKHQHGLVTRGPNWMIFVQTRRAPKTK